MYDKKNMEGYSRRNKVVWTIALSALVLSAAYCAWAVRRPLPPVAAMEPQIEARAPVPGGKPLAWPAGGQAAVGIAGSRILETRGKQTGVPTASTAKLITALSVLRKHPLALGEQGPTITLNPKDVAIYNSYVAREGSVVPVKNGEKITEYQMLEAILLPSANNIADSLAIWSFGSLGEYAEYANDYVKNLGLSATRIGDDASGFAPSTVSSARDLTKLGEIAMSNQVLSQIVGKSSTTGIPGTGNARNVNFLLGTSNIVGIKTGNTDQAGGVFVAAANIKVNGKRTTIVTAVLGAPDLFSAMKYSLQLIQSAQANFKPATIIKSGSIAGRYGLPWGGSVSAAAEQSLELDGWAGGNIPFTISLKPISLSAKAGQTVGTLTVNETALNDQKTIPIKLKSTPPGPSVLWRLTHPL